MTIRDYQQDPAELSNREFSALSLLWHEQREQLTDVKGLTGALTENGLLKQAKLRDYILLIVELLRF